MKDKLFSALSPHQGSEPPLRRLLNLSMMDCNRVFLSGRHPEWEMSKNETKKKSQLGLHDGCFPSQSVRRSHADRQDANCKSLWNVMTGRHAPRDETWLFAGVKPEADKKAFEAPIVLGASC